MAPTILIVDDEKHIRDGIGEFFAEEGFSVKTAPDGKAGLQIVKSHEVDVVITDLKMMGLSGTELMSEIQKIDSTIPVIILTAYSSVENAVECMRKGAFDYRTKPVNLDELQVLVMRALDMRGLTIENESLHHQLNNKFGIVNIIGHSPEMERVLEVVRTVAPSKANVHITGESGTGKELIANALHALSDRHKQPLVKVHCAALATGLLESELFGHEKGAFTGASRQHRGRFELAHGGTLFLDEIGDIDANIQVKLLRVLQEKTFERVGGEETITVDVRLITATNKDLFQLVQEGKFREDLYYRLKVVHVELPPLRDRRLDIPILADSFLKEFCRENNKKPKKIGRKAMAALEQYRWPGNVRELKNVIENLVVMTKGSVIDQQDLPDFISRNKAPAALQLQPGKSLDEYEKDIILATLAQVDGNKSKAAELLGIGRKTLHRKLEQYNEFVSK